MLFKYIHIYFGELVNLESILYTCLRMLIFDILSISKKVFFHTHTWNISSIYKMRMSVLSADIDTKQIRESIAPIKHEFEFYKLLLKLQT